MKSGWRLHTFVIVSGRVNKFVLPAYLSFDIFIAILVIVAKKSMPKLRSIIIQYIHFYIVEHSFLQMELVNH